ncbi:MAG: hypothetical protein AAFP20_14715 [Cyanobacteria bacterium J06614_10]
MLGIVGFLVFLAIALGAGYAIARKILGPQAAQRNVLYSAPWLVLGALLPLLLSATGRYGLVILYALYAGGVLLWLLSWPLRKRAAGTLLLEVGPTVQNRLLFWVGLLQIGIAIAMTIPLWDQVTGPFVTTGNIVSGIIKLSFWWIIALLFIALGRSRLEIRENGLAYLYSWQPWERIQAFGWDDDKPETLILKAIPRTFFSRRYLTLSIPKQSQPQVDALLEDYLLERDLAAEMDGEDMQAAD